MPWTPHEKFCGFSTVEPWLPVPDEHRRRAVDVQESNPDSVLNACRRFLTWRRQHPALRAGSIRFVDAPDNILAFVRKHEKESLLAAFNLSGDSASISIPSHVTPLAVHGFTGVLSQREIQLPPYDAFFGKIEV
jgi:alpha-glucosidase